MIKQQYLYLLFLFISNIFCNGQIILKSSDGGEYPVNVEAAQTSEVLVSMLHNIDYEPDSDITIPICHDRRVLGIIGDSLIKIQKHNRSNNADDWFCDKSLVRGLKGLIRKLIKDDIKSEVFFESEAFFDFDIKLMAGSFSVRFSEMFYEPKLYYELINTIDKLDIRGIKNIEVLKLAFLSCMEEELGKESMNDIFLRNQNRMLIDDTLGCATSSKLAACLEGNFIVAAKEGGVWGCRVYDSNGEDRGGFIPGYYEDTVGSNFIIWANEGWGCRVYDSNGEDKSDFIPGFYKDTVGSNFIVAVEEGEASGCRVYDSNGEIKIGFIPGNYKGTVGSNFIVSVKEGGVCGYRVYDSNGEDKSDFIPGYYEDTVGSNFIIWANEGWGCRVYDSNGEIKIGFIPGNYKGTVGSNFIVSVEEGEASGCRVYDSNGEIKIGFIPGYYRANFRDYIVSQHCFESGLILYNLHAGSFYFLPNAKFVSTGANKAMIVEYIDGTTKPLYHAIIDSFKEPEEELGKES